MVSAKKLQERVPLRLMAWKLASSPFFSPSLPTAPPRCCVAPRCWLTSLVYETWFALVWLLNMNYKWNSVQFETHPGRLFKRPNELPAVDMFVTTAEPELEPPVVMVNTVLSLLVMDYLAGKLACYISDDGCSPLTCYALLEVATFARLWVLFCRRHGVGVKAPFIYFSSDPEPGMADQEFLRDWTFIKSEYEKLISQIENAEEGSLVLHNGEFTDLLGVERKNHPTIIKILWDNSKSTTGEGFPSLIYISREKSHKYHHHSRPGPSMS